ncbi:MAG: hypothetical protein ACOC0D_09135, partial [Spirochaeta sp.]
MNGAASSLSPLLFMLSLGITLSGSVLYLYLSLQTFKRYYLPLFLISFTATVYITLSLLQPSAEQFLIPDLSLFSAQRILSLIGIILYLYFIFDIMRPESKRQRTAFIILITTGSLSILLIIAILVHPPLFWTPQRI